jgi:hypothetical protein
MSTVAEARLLELPRISRPQGNITPVEGGVTIPFEIERVYYLYDVIGGAARGAHAHRSLEQLVVATMGGFTVVLDDGKARREIRLARGYEGLYLPPMLWRELRDFTSGAVGVVLASCVYDEADYIRDYDEFVALKRVASETRS